MFPTINVHAMLHQCHFSYVIISTMITCAIVASIHILLFSLLIILLQINAIAISNLDADATAKNNYFLIDQSSGTLKKELVFL